VAELAIERTAPAGTDDIPLGETFTLEARPADVSSEATWHRGGEEIGTGASFSEEATKGSAGSYVVKASVDGDVKVSSPYELNVADATPEPTPETPPVYHSGFALITGVLGLLIAAVLLWRPASAAWQISKSDWTAEEGGDNALAAALSVPLVVFGGALVALGAWMAAVEWRGRFKAEQPEGGGVRALAGAVDVPAVVAAIGKLRGAALVLVVGAVLMLGAAWVAQSSAEEPAAAAPASPTPTVVP